MTSCWRCDDTGIAWLDVHHPDPNVVKGYRTVMVCYRCYCDRGRLVSAKFPPLPLEPLPPRRPLTLPPSENVRRLRLVRGDDPE